MPVVRNCCFILNLKDSCILIGFLSSGVAFAGLITAMMDILKLLKLPEDACVASMLEIAYFLGLQGVAFHAVFLLVSLILVWGALKDVAPLLVPWVGWCPFVIVLVVANLCIVLEKDSKYMAALICFAITMFIFLIYASIVLTSHFQQLLKLERQLVEESGSMIPGSNIQPNSRNDYGQGNSSQQRELGSSTDWASMRDRLSRSYAKLLMASQSNVGHPPPHRE